MTQYGLPKWPQKANKLRQIRGCRRRLMRELETIAELAKQWNTPTEDRPVMHVISDIERAMVQTPGASPTYQERP